MISIEKEVLNLYNKDANSAYASLKELVKISGTSNEVYSYMKEFLHMLNHTNSYVRTRGIILCSANAKWDDKQLLDQHIMEYLSHFEDEKPITSRQCIQQVQHIARYKPQLCPCILDALQTTSVTYADSMQSLVYKDRQKAIRQVMQWREEYNAG